MLIRVAILILLSGGLPFASAAASFLSSGSLCKSDEKEYFGCTLQGSNKIVSVCAANNTTPDMGYVQYRYGTQSFIEFRYPSVLVPPIGKMTFVDVSRFSEGLGSHLKFNIDAYEYVVSNSLAPGEVYVVKNGKVVFEKICKGSGYQSIDDNIRRGVPYGIVDFADRLLN